MRYTGEDYIAMRANGERGKWWTAALLIFGAFTIFCFVACWSEPESDSAGWTLKGLIAFALPIVVGVYCLIKGYRKDRFSLMDGDDVSYGNFGGD